MICSWRFWAALAWIAASTPACQRARLDPDEYAARTTVERYNQDLVQAFRRGDVTPLRDVAAPEELQRIAEIIAELRARGKVMVARQTDFRVRRIVVNTRERAVTLVEVMEAWNYQHRDADAPEREVPAKTERYRLVYELIRPADRFLVWKVTQYELPPEERAPAR